MRTDILTLRIRVLDICGAYKARVWYPGPLASASCSAGAEAAAMKCVEKVLSPEGIQVREIACKEQGNREFVYTGFTRNPESVNRAALLREQARLQARLDEINAALEGKAAR